MTYDDQGRIYISDQYNHRFQIVDANGNFLRTIGAKGQNQLGLFNEVCDITFDKKNRRLHVVDARNYRIQTYSLDGQPLSSFGSQGRGDGQFYCPIGITTDSRGNLYVCEWENSRVSVFDEKFNFIRHFGSGQLKSPFGVGVLSSGEIVVCDAGNSRLALFDFNGNFLRSIDNLPNARYVHVGPKDTLVVSCSSSVKVLTKDGSEVRSLSEGKMQNPWGVLVKPDGGIFATDWNLNCIFVFPHPNIYKAIKGNGSLIWNCNEVRGMTIGSDGTIFVTNSVQKNISCLDLEGNLVKTIAQGKLKYAHDVAFDVKNNRLVVIDTPEEKVKVFKLPNGEEIFSFGSKGEGRGQFQAPWGVACDKDGRIYVADTLNHRVQVFDQEGCHLLTVSENGLKTPAGIGVMANGNIVVGQRDKKKISLYSPQGTLLKEIDNISNPLWIFIDSQDNIIAPCNLGSSCVRIFSSDLSLLHEFPTGETWSAVVWKGKVFVGLRGGVKLFA